ncbi:MAG: hypothetical protein AAGJ94_10420, partial [Pseudomonadota bacterium]
KGTSPAGGSGTERLTTWLSSREALIARAQRAVTDIVESGAVSISRVAVASGLLYDLAGESQKAA